MATDRHPEANMKSTVLVAFEVDADDGETAEALVDDRLLALGLVWHKDGDGPADPIKRCAVLPLTRALEEGHLLSSDDAVLSDGDGR